MNKVILCGRLTAMPELKYTGSNKPYARFSLAVNRTTPNSTTGEREADFINCISWGKQAEVLAKYLDKGSQLLIGGRIQITSFNGKDGNKRTSTDIVVEEFEFVGSKKQESKESKATDSSVSEDFGKEISIDDNLLD